jgi:hypothetical protein
MPPARTTAAPVVAHSSTGDRSMRSSHQKLTVDATPSASNRVAQSLPTWMASAATTTGIRKAPRW